MKLIDLPKGTVPKTTHTYAYDKGVTVHGWVVGVNPFNEDELLFLQRNGDMAVVHKGIVKEKEANAGPVIISGKFSVAIFNGLIKNITGLSPATRDYHPGIGAGMLNTLIDYARQLKQATE